MLLVDVAMEGRTTSFWTLGESPSPGSPLRPESVAAIADSALLLRFHRGAAGTIS